MQYEPKFAMHQVACVPMHIEGQDNVVRESSLSVTKAFGASLCRRLLLSRRLCVWRRVEMTPAFFSNAIYLSLEVEFSPATWSQIQATWSHSLIR